MLARKARGGLIKNWTVYVIGLESIFVFLWTVQRWYLGAKIGKVEVIDEILMVWSQLLQMLWFGLPSRLIWW